MLAGRGLSHSFLAWHERHEQARNVAQLRVSRLKSPSRALAVLH